MNYELEHFKEMVEKTVDATCANDIWDLVNNMNDQFFEEKEESG